jgi:hypothetical protein
VKGRGGNTCQNDIKIKKGIRHKNPGQSSSPRFNLLILLTCELPDESLCKTSIIWKQAATRKNEL